MESMDVKESIAPNFLDDDFDDTEEDTLEDMYLVFSCQDKKYCLEIRYVTEIIGLQAITEVPDLPEYIKGLINLRGRVIPVMDIRSRFNIPEMEYSERTCFIITNIEEFAMGLIVDGVNEVLKIPALEVEPAPAMGDALNKFIRGIGKVDGEIRILLDLHNLVNDDPLKNSNFSAEGQEFL